MLLRIVLNFLSDSYSLYSTKTGLWGHYQDILIAYPASEPCAIFKISILIEVDGR